MLTIETDKGTVQINDQERTPCEVYTRVMGYYRPVSEFNVGKKQEHADRVFFNYPFKEMQNGDE
jgi:anaerobic ribonucleoside-triphosphate reductase